MAEKTFGETLRSLREREKLSVKEVVEKLKQYALEITDKTLYSYESDKRAASAEMLLALCQIYNCNNILETFAKFEPDYTIPDDSEWKLIEKYRSLDSAGKNTVDVVIEQEIERSKEVFELLKRIEQLENEPSFMPPQMRAISYYQRLASAGTGQIVFDGIPVDKIEIPDVPEYRRVSYAIGVNGNSMEPLYHNGDILLIEPTCKIDVGEIGIFIIGDESYVKKLGKGKLISLNAGYGDILLTEYSKCMGRVIDKISKYPELSDEDANALREGMLAAQTQKKKA